MPKLPITDTASIYQFQRSSNTEQYSTQPIYQNVNICISPVGTDIQATFGNVPGFSVSELYIMDVTIDIHNGDKIVTSGGQVFTVDGVPFVMNNQYAQYIKCLIRQVV